MKNYPSFSSLPGLAPATVVSVACLKVSQHASANIYVHYTLILSKAFLEEIHQVSRTPAQIPTLLLGHPVVLSLTVSLPQAHV